MSLDLACAALGIMYSIVIESEVREFQALVACQGLAMGRFRTWFLQPDVEHEAISLNATSFERRTLL